MCVGAGAAGDANAVVGVAGESREEAGLAWDSCVCVRCEMVCGCVRCERGCVCAVGVGGVSSGGTRGLFSCGGRSSFGAEKQTHTKTQWSIDWDILLTLRGDSCLPASSDILIQKS